MKTLKEYLSESTQVYSFKIKVAGGVPDKFEENLKLRLDRCKVISLKKIATTPIQQLPLDFPNHPNSEVTIFEIVCAYPITAPELTADVKEMGLDEACFRVRNSSDALEVEQVLAKAEPSGEALLNDAQYKEADDADHKDYFGADFNKSFLKELSKTAKQQKKDNGQGEYKLPKVKQNQEGAKSAIGSK